MTIEKFTDHKYAHAHIEYKQDGTIVLVSYTTPVIVITADGWLHCSGLYSATTRRHIGWFMRMYGLSYKLAKMSYELNFDYNINTGEIVYA